MINEQLRPVTWCALKSGDLICDERGKNLQYIAGPDQALLAGVCVRNNGILKIVPAATLREKPEAWLGQTPLYAGDLVKDTSDGLEGSVIKEGKIGQVIIHPSDNSFVSTPRTVANLVKLG